MQIVGPAPTSWSLRLGLGNLWVNKPSRWFWYTVKLENHCANLNYWPFLNFLNYLTRCVGLSHREWALCINVWNEIVSCLEVMSVDLSAFNFLRHFYGIYNFLRKAVNIYVTLWWKAGMVYNLPIFLQKSCGTFTSQTRIYEGWRKLQETEVGR